MKTELTQEQKRIKIAEACPFVEKYGKGELLWKWQGRRIYFDPFNDLNACHEAESIVFRGTDLWREFVFELIETCGMNRISEIDGLCYIVKTTAEQRAEAFGKTLGLW